MPSSAQTQSREAAGTRENIPIEKPRAIPAPTSDELKAAAQGNPSAQYWAGMSYSLSVPPDDKLAAFWLERAATQGHAQAQWNLGWIYANGKGVERNDKQAIFWYQKAAAQGSGAAQVSLGSMYEEGRGVAKDDKLAAFWFEKAAAHGDIGAQFMLYSLYTKGEAKDNVEALKWAAIAVANGMGSLGKTRQALEMEMTQEQIAEAQRRASEWMKAHK